MTKIKTGDTVRVMTGSTEKGKGREGKVLKIDTKKGKVLVEGINIVKRHSKPSAQNQTGGIIEKEAPIDISNVMLVHKGEPTRIGFKVVDGKKVRVAKSNGDVID
jgi:large subunit ribosomal protein L24